jgi:enoyl-CoA hydratase/carnithine racemase
MEKELSTVTRSDKIVTVSLSNPPLNVLTLKMRKTLMRQLIELGNDRTSNVVIIQSATPKAFSAGFDLKDFPNDEAGGLEMIRFAQHVLNIIFNLPQVTIVKLQGHVLGGGACMMLVSDLRIASESAKIGMPEIKAGCFSAGGGTHMLARQVPFARAKEMVLLGDSMSASEAMSYGLINRVTTEAELDATVATFAERISGYSRTALTAAKRSVNAMLTLPFEAGQTMEAEGMASLFRGRDIFEGVSAFTERRSTKFTD